MDDLNLDPFSDGLSKSRKSSGFSETHSGGNNGKGGSGNGGNANGGGSANGSGSKSRNCSGGSSISQGLVSSGILPPPSNPLPVPGSGSSPPPGMEGSSTTSPPRQQQQQQLMQQQLQNTSLMQQNGHENVSCKIFSRCCSFLKHFLFSCRLLWA